MELIAGVLSFALCAWVYVRMYKREVPEPMPKKNAVIPVVLGLVAPFLVVGVVILIGYAIRAILHGGTISENVSSLVLRSLLSSFLGAGFTEEFVKCLLILLTVKIIKPRNVYEYILVGAGVGFGFTLVEEISYGSGGGVLTLFRMVDFALHMLWGIIMASYFGRARYNKQNDLGGSGKLIFMGCFIPVLWHTVFDASTATNAGLGVEDSDMIMLISVSCAVVVLVVTAILQFVLLKKYKNKAEEYSNLLLD